MGEVDSGVIIALISLLGTTGTGVLAYITKRRDELVENLREQIAALIERNAELEEDQRGTTIEIAELRARVLTIEDRAKTEQLRVVLSCEYAECPLRHSFIEQGLT